MRRIVWELYSVKKTNELTSLLLTMFDWINEAINVSDEVWIWVHQKCWMSQIVRKLHEVKTNKCIYITVINDGRLNQWNNEWQWWSMKVGALKLWNEYCMKIVFVQEEMHLPCCSQLWSIKCTSMKVSALKLFNELNRTRFLLSQNKQMHLPCCSQKWSIELTKQWMRVMKYEGESIKTM